MPAAMTPALRWLPLVLVAGTGLYWFARGFRDLRTARRLRDMPTARVRSLPQGSVELSGTAHSAEPATAPFTGKACAYYEAEVLEHRRSGKRSRWVTRHREASSLPFWLDDGTGRVCVLPAGAETHLPLDYHEEFSGFGSLPGAAEQALARWGIGGGFLSRERLRLRERRIDLGCPVFVYGVTQAQPDLRRRAVEATNARLRALRSDPEAIARADLDGDGRLSDAEWEIARAAAAKSSLSDVGIEPVVVAGGTHGETFLISDRDERELWSSLRLRAFGGVFGGAALVIGAAGWLLRELGQL
jgi:hypothetical protein